MSSHRSPFFRSLVVLGTTTLLLASCERTAPPPPVPAARPAAPAPRVAARPDFAGAQATEAVHELVEWAVASGDPGGKPFAVIDKRDAHIHVFSAAGRLTGSSWVLIGLAPGDVSEPGIGTKAIDDIRPDERTTPAGRFVTVAGRNAKGHPVVWVDYDDAISMHGVISVPGEHRLERLASPDPARHRISFGCINVPTSFFENVALPAFAHRGGIIYVLPDTRPLQDVFPALGAYRRATAAAHSPPAAVIAER